MRTHFLLAISFLSLTLSLTPRPVSAWSGKVSCPETVEPSHQKEVMATSAPEVKVRTTLQNDSKRWFEIVRPLTTKAIKLAKKDRSELIQNGIESSCMTSQTFVAQVVPMGDKPSGCEHRIITRPADDEHIWVQVIATCRYDWACCATEDAKALKTGTTAGFTLEGPLGTPSASSSKSTK